MFALTFKLKGGLNQITFLFRFHLVFWDGLREFHCCLASCAVSYVILPFLNSVLSQDKFEMQLLVIDGNWLIIDGGWLDFEFMYRGALFGFLKGKYFPVFKLKDTSKKSVSMRFVSIAIDSPPFLNKLIMSFPNLPSFGPLALCTMASPSLLYNITLLVPKRGFTLFRRYNPTSSHTSPPSKLPIVISNNGILPFLPKFHYHQIIKIFLQWFMNLYFALFLIALNHSITAGVLSTGCTEVYFLILR